MARTPKKTPKRKADNKATSAGDDLIPETKEAKIIPMPLINNGDLLEVLTTANTYVGPGDFEKVLTRGRATLYYEVPRDKDMFDSGPIRPENAYAIYEYNEFVPAINRRTVNIGNCPICYRAGAIGLQCMSCAEIDVTHYHQLVTMDPNDQQLMTVQPIALATAIGHEPNDYSWGSIIELEQYFYTPVESKNEYNTKEENSEPATKKGKYDESKRLTIICSSSDESEPEEKETKPIKNPEDTEDQGPYMNWDAVLLEEQDKYVIMAKAYEHGQSINVQYTPNQIKQMEKIKEKLQKGKKGNKES